MKRYKEAIITYISCLVILFLFLFVCARVIYKGTNNIEGDTIVTSVIDVKDDNSNIYVEYPRFKNEKVNSIITSILYSYIKEFKNNDIYKSLNISYQLYYLKEYVNVTFYIDNSLNNIKYKNIIIDLDNNELAYINSLLDEELLRNEILELVRSKYTLEIYDRVVDSSINNYTYLISDNEIDVYFNNIEFNDLNYIPFVTITNYDIINNLK